MQILPLAQAVVRLILIDCAFTSICDLDGSSYEIRIEQAFGYPAAAGATVTPDPEDDPTGRGPALPALARR